MTGPHLKLRVAVLNQEAHSRTCGYWYTVSSHGTAHTAFATRAGFMNWMRERGLSVEGEVPEPGTLQTMEIVGAYRSSMGWDVAGFNALDGERTRTLSNGQYTLAIITADSDGLRTVHTLNPNVADRVVYDHAESRRAFS